MTDKKKANAGVDIEPIELEATVTDEVLEETPGRVLKFLRTVGTSVPIRAALQARGYTQQVHARAWDLIHQVSGFTPGEAAPETSHEVAEAIKTIDHMDEDLFRVVRATLVNNFPDQAALVFGGGLTASTGTAAVAGVKKLLDRLDELEDADERKATRKQDQEALSLLAVRGIDDKERARLRKLVGLAQSLPEVQAEAEGGAGVRESHRKALIDLRRWYEEWSEIARVTTKRRDYLIRLGLAKRKAPKKAKQEPQNG